MTCKDCVGFDFCSSRAKYTEEEIEALSTTNDIRDICSFFKNKNNFVEITLCKDCCHAESMIGCFGGEVLYCHHHNHNVDDNDFCSEGC